MTSKKQAITQFQRVRSSHTTLGKIFPRVAQGVIFFDWRLGLEDLLLQDALRLAWESEADTLDLKYHINQYLNALAHFNAVTGHRKVDIILRRSPGGEVHQTCKGEKLKSQPKSGRGRGRPPKSNIKFY